MIPARVFQNSTKRTEMRHLQGRPLQGKFVHITKVTMHIDKQTLYLEHAQYSEYRSYLLLHVGTIP